MTAMFYMAHNPARSYRIKNEIPGKSLGEMPNYILKFIDLLIMTQCCCISWSLASCL